MGIIRASEIAGSAVDERAGECWVGVVGFRTGRQCRAGGARADLSLVSRSAMGPGLGQHLRLGLESLPRPAACRRPGRSDGQRTLGTPAVVGAAATIATAVGPGRQRDVEPDRQWVGILEQQHLDSGLTRYPDACRITPRPPGFRAPSRTGRELPSIRTMTRRSRFSCSWSASGQLRQPAPLPSAIQPPLDGLARVV